MLKKYLAELIGTFALSFVVLLAVASASTPIPVPVIAGLTLALFVYSIGALSGCHINPSVTLGLLSIKKINVKDAVGYIVAQFIGAYLAIAIAHLFGISGLVAAGAWSNQVFFAEMLGSIFFTFGIASVVYGKAKEQMSGIVVGGSLTLGVLIAVFTGAAGILNPAVALALNSFTVAYIFAPIVGALIGFNLYKYVANER